MKKPSDIKNQIYQVGCCLMVVVVISLLNLYSTPTMSDDVMYRFIWQQEWQLPFERIASLADVVQSQIVHYNVINGRSIIHFLAQIALNLIPASLAKLINIAMFILLLWLTNLYIVRKREYRLIVGVLTFSFLFLMMRSFDTVFLWLLGSFSYVWTFIFTVSFLLLLRKLGTKRMEWQLLPLIPIAFLFGWSHEGIALPLSLSFLLYMIVNHRHLFVHASTYCMIAYVLGMLMIVTSPALWFRADMEGISLSQRLLAGGINLFMNVRISWLLMMTLIWIAVKNKSQFADILRSHFYMLFAWIMALGIVFVCGTTLERVAACADFLAIIILLQIWQSQKLLDYQYAIINLLLIVTILVAVPAIAYSKQNYDNYLYHCSQLQKKDNTLIRIRQTDPHLGWLQNTIADRFVNPSVAFGFYSCYMAFDNDDCNSMAVAQLYHQKSVIMLPEDVVNKIETDTAAYTHWESDEHQQLFVQLLPRHKEVHRVTFLLGEEVALNFYQRLLSYQENEYQLDFFKYKVVGINSRSYLVMTIPPSNIKRRIKDIKIE